MAGKGDEEDKRGVEEEDEEEGQLLRSSNLTRRK